MSNSLEITWKGDNIVTLVGKPAIRLLQKHKVVDDLRDSCVGSQPTYVYNTTRRRPLLNIYTELCLPAVNHNSIITSRSFSRL